MDETLIRMDKVCVLTDAGFEVIEASNADEAIDLMVSHRDVDAIVPDINMPGSMNGLKLDFAKPLRAEGVVDPNTGELVNNVKEYVFDKGDVGAAKPANDNPPAARQAAEPTAKSPPWSN